jgi:glycosyltransferase involved in cell wall biosynthesis
MSSYECVSVVVPALNESETLPELFSLVSKAIGPDQPFEFIVIDDGSSDGTFELLTRMRDEHPNIIVVRHARPHGKSLALMQGFDVARGEVVITMDADLQDRPEAIPQLLAKLEDGFDLVNGWRRDRDDPLSRKMVSKLYNIITRRLLKCPLHDINCGLKAMRRKVYKMLQLNGDLHRLIPAIVSAYGFKVAEVPVPHAPRTHGQSRYRLFRHRGLLDIVAFSAAHTTQLRPFHVFTELAVLFWLLALTCMGGLLAIGLLVDGLSVGVKWLSFLLVGVSAWAVFVGTVLPLFGLHLDFVSRPYQDKEWRHSLVEKSVGAAE